MTKRSTALVTRRAEAIDGSLIIEGVDEPPFRVVGRTEADDTAAWVRRARRGGARSDLELLSQ